VRSGIVQNPTRKYYAQAYRVIKGALETPHYKAAPGNESSGRDGCKMIRHQSQIVAVGELRGAPKKLVRGLSPELNPKNANVSTQSAAVAINDREQK
jgi:hypothetical protein